MMVHLSTKLGFHSNHCRKIQPLISHYPFERRGVQREVNQVSQLFILSLLAIQQNEGKAFSFQYSEVVLLNPHIDVNSLLQPCFTKKNTTICYTGEPHTKVKVGTEPPDLCEMLARTCVCVASERNATYLQGGWECIFSLQPHIFTPPSPRGVDRSQMATVVTNLAKRTTRVRYCCLMPVFVCVCVHACDVCACVFVSAIAMMIRWSVSLCFARKL